MCALIHLFIVNMLTIYTQAQETNLTLVDYYVQLIENRTLAAQNYQLPTDARMYEPENKTIEEYGKFDFIVVGAGSTGSIIANRLSEVRGWSVLLLEAGTFPGKDLTRIPALYGVDGTSKFNWGYKSVPQKNICFSSANNICNLSRGKGIGGTSLIHGLQYMIANKLDYDNWADSLNDSSYRYENLFRYFLKSENFTQTDPNVPIDWEYHGKRGPQHVTQSIIPSELQTAILEGNQQFGQPLIDYNGRQQLGVSVMQSYLKNGFRNDPGLAYISSARNRQNLKVLDQSYVIRLDINNDTKRINGVIFSRNNRTFIARNRKEVILSAGTIGSPQILLLSGVGPKDHLKALGIPVIQNLPVGKNLRDHVTSIMRFSSNATFINQTIDEQVRELLEGRGRLTAIFDLNAITFFKLPKGVPQDTTDLEVTFRNFQSGFPDSPSTFDIKIEIFYPNSVGSLQLKSADPFEYPLIDPNGLSDDGDLELLYEGAQIVMQLTKTEAFRRFNVTLALTEVEECNQAEPLSKEYWLCHLKRITRHAGHLMGTCATGKTPKTGVVDKKLRVFGVKGLRVADVSVFPFPFANHPTATCSAIAEKISDQIKNLYNK